MKKVYNLVTAITLSLLTVGAVAQQVTTTVTKKIVRQKVKTSVSAVKHLSHKPDANNTYVFLDYPYSDSLAGTQFLLSYAGSPSLGQYYIQDFNTHYVVGDSGATATNNTLIKSFSVAFDTLIDANTGTSYSYKNGIFNNGVTVDSLFIPIGQQNVSGNMDTVKVQINTVTAAGLPTATMLWDTLIVRDTGLSGKGKSFLYGYELMLHPHLTVNAPFAVTVNYYAMNKRDSCGFLYGFPTSTCGGNSQFPDTTKIGTKVKGIYKLNAAHDSIKGVVSMTANSFLTGWQYISAAKAATTNPILTMPGKQTYSYPTNTYLGGDDYFGQQCTVGSNTVVSSNGYQDIALYALLSMNVNGIKTIYDNGLSVGQNFPNPWNRTTQISYSLTKSSDVSFSVSDITGRKLVDNSYAGVSPGKHVISLDANSFAPGVYFYTVSVNGNAVTRKMVITE